MFGEYKCLPGVEVDRYQEGDRWNILISLRETKSSGDIEDFYIDDLEQALLISLSKSIQPTCDAIKTSQLSGSLDFPLWIELDHALLHTQINQISIYLPGCFNT